MMLTSKIRIYPSTSVQASFWQGSRSCTFVWNFTIDQRNDNPSLTVYEQKREIPKLKSEFPELKRPSSQVLQNVVFSVDQAYKMFQTKRRRSDAKVKPPRHKKMGIFFTQEYSQKDVSFKFISDESGTILKLAYGSKPQDWLYIPIDLVDYDNAKTVTIIYKNKKWYACVTSKVILPAQKKEGQTIYFDPGVLMALTGIKTTKEFCEYSLRPLYEINRESYKYIDQLKAARASKKKGSYHYRRLSEQIRGTYSKISTRTKIYLHSLANKILDDHPDVAVFKIGDWSKKDTLANTGNRYIDRKINRAVQNNHPLETLIGYLTYKALLRGQAVERFDERGTTRSCSACSYVSKTGIEPSVRTFKCPQCLFTFPRDYNSCLNFVRKFDAALWQCLSGNLPDRSIRTGFHPFLFKLRYNTYVIAAS